MERGDPGFPKGCASLASPLTVQIPGNDSLLAGWSWWQWSSASFCSVCSSACRPLHWGCLVLFCCYLVLICCVLVNPNGVVHLVPYRAKSSVAFCIKAKKKKHDNGVSAYCKNRVVPFVDLHFRSGCNSF